MIYALNFLIGTLLAVYVPSDYSNYFLWLLLLLFVVLLLRKKYDLCRLFLVLITAFLWALFYGHQLLEKQVKSHWFDQKITISGMVADLPKIATNKTQFTFRSQQPFVANLKLSWYHNEQTPTLKVGEKWRLKVKLKPNNGLHTRFGFDYETWLFSRGFSATGYVIDKGDNQPLGKSNQYLLNQTRASIKNKLLPILADLDQGGIIYALISGDRHLINEGQWQQFIKSNTSHLTVVSGLHIGLISGFVFFLSLFFYKHCYRCCLQMPAPVFAGLVAIIAALIYALLAGFPTATERAFIMASTVFLSIIFKKRMDIWLLYATALIIVLVRHPLSVLEVGFWLSFIAVAIILYGINRYRYQRKLSLFFSIQILISLAMLPLLFWFFSGAGLTSIPANLFAVPLVSFVVLPLSLLAIVPTLLGLDNLAGALFYLANLGLDILLAYLSWLGHFKFSYLHWYLNLGQLLLVLVAMFVLFLPRGFQLNWLGLIILVSVFSYQAKSNLKAGEFQLTTFDVGQGLAVLIQTQKQTFLFDTGFANQTFNAAEAVIIPFLKAKRIKQLNGLIISHGDSDHIGGLAVVLPYVKLGQIVSSLPQQIQKSYPDLVVKPCQAGQNWQIDGITLTILNPPPKSYKKDNNNSCVLKISNGQYSVLLTGDIEKKAEKNLVKTYNNQLQSDILIVPHHGSKTSSTEHFLQTIRPSIAINSSGFRNRFNHPHPHVKKRYDNHGIEFYDTQCSGQISLFISSTITIKQSRLEDSRYWVRQCGTKK